MNKLLKRIRRSDEKYEWPINLLNVCKYINITSESLNGWSIKSAQKLKSYIFIIKQRNRYSYNIFKPNLLYGGGNRTINLNFSKLIATTYVVRKLFSNFESTTYSIT